jgi:hypothetical protein
MQEGGILKVLQPAKGRRAFSKACAWITSWSRRLVPEPLSWLMLLSLPGLWNAPPGVSTPLRNGRPTPSYERSSESDVVLVIPGAQANTAFVRLIV